MLDNSKQKVSLGMSIGFMLQKSWILLGGLAVVIVIGACQNNKNKSSPQPPLGLPPNYYPGNYGGALCPTCNMNVAWTIFAGTDSQTPSGSIAMGLDFYGDPNTGYNFYDPHVPSMYTGPVVVRGQLTVNAVDSLYCMAPAGQYQIISLSPGQWESGVVTSTQSGFGPTSLYMEARSQFGVAIILRLAKGIIYNPNGTNSWYPNNLGGTLVFESINGAPCSSYSGPAYAELQ
jgi:hypothetical protein